MKKERALRLQELYSDEIESVNDNIQSNREPFEENNLSPEEGKYINNQNFQRKRSDDNKLSFNNIQINDSHVPLKPETIDNDKIVDENEKNEENNLTLKKETPVENILSP